MKAIDSLRLRAMEIRARLADLGAMPELTDEHRAENGHLKD